MARAVGFIAAGVGLGVVACSWTRFDDVQENAPVLLLTKPDGVGFGFGSSVAVGQLKDGDKVTASRVFIGAAAGRSGGAEFDPGLGQGMSPDAVRSGHCGLGCTLAKTAAALPRANLEGKDHTLCVAEGLGTSEGQKTLGIQLQCAADTAAGSSAYLSVNELPPGSALTAASSKFLTLASVNEDFPILMAGVAAHQVEVNGQLSDVPSAAWFYASKSQTPVVLEAPSVSPAPGGSYGAAVALANVKGAWWLLVGEPDAGRVLVFDDTGTLTGCLEPGIAKFGRTLAAGRVDADGDDELVIASEKAVHVLSGALLATQLKTACGAPPAGSELVALACRTTADLDGCGGSQFGAALAVADFDQDKDGEVLVGAPGMAVRDEGEAGAVFVFDVEGDHLDWMLEARFISSAESGDRLGTAIGVVHQNDRDIFVAGAPGHGKAAVFFCSKLLPSGKRGARCK